MKTVWRWWPRCPQTAETPRTVRKKVKGYIGMCRMTTRLLGPGLAEIVFVHGRGGFLVEETRRPDGYRF